MNNSTREAAKKQYRQHEVLMLKEQWFQQDLQEAEMKKQLGGLPLLPNLRNELLFENDLTQQERLQIQLYFERQLQEAERKATEYRRKMRHQQIADLQKTWLEQDRREAKAKADAERFLRDLSVTN